MNPFFKDIVNYSAKKSFLIDIYTNGKNFSNKSICNLLNNNGNYYVRIPLFGSQNKHDFFTGGLGNYAETMRGLQNIVNTKAYKKGFVQIEIKLLLAKDCLGEYINIFTNLESKGLIKYFKYSLNPLLISEKVIFYKEYFISSYSDMLLKCNNFFEYTQNKGIDISLDLIPFCVMPEDLLYREIKKKKHKMSFVEAQYSDTKSNVLKNNHYDIDECLGCHLKRICPKFPKSYINYFGKEEVDTSLINKIC